MGLLIFKILPMLIEHRILRMGNTVEMAGGDIDSDLSYSCYFLSICYFIIFPLNTTIVAKFFNAKSVYAAYGMTGFSCK